MCNCRCCCCSERSCCDPIIPANDKSKCWRWVLIFLLSVHAIVIIVKIIYLGLFSILVDLAAFVVLWVAIARYDYCLAITYVILNLIEVFGLIVVLGYYL